MKRWNRRESGMAFVEMALVLPLLLVIGVAVADFGRAFYWGITLSQAARAGAAYGAQSIALADDGPGIIQAARREAQNLADPTSSTVDVTPTRICECAPGCPCTPGATVACTGGACSAPNVFVRVTTSATFRMIFPYGLPSQLTISRTAQLRVQ